MSLVEPGGDTLRLAYEDADPAGDRQARRVGGPPPEPATSVTPCKMPCWAWMPRRAKLPRAGLIHRLDKDTSGPPVVARTAEAQTSLSRQLSGAHDVA